jgi:hypothetical protein
MFIGSGPSRHHAFFRLPVISSKYSSISAAAGLATGGEVILMLFVLYEKSRMKYTGA